MIDSDFPREGKCKKSSMKCKIVISIQLIKGWVQCFSIKVVINFLLNLEKKLASIGLFVLEKNAKTT